jgi:hypothetical protein
MGLKVLVRRLILIPQANGARVIPAKNDIQGNRGASRERSEQRGSVEGTPLLAWTDSCQARNAEIMYLLA